MEVDDFHEGGSAMIHTQTPCLEPLKANNRLCEEIKHNLENIKAKIDERKAEIRKVERALAQPDLAQPNQPSTEKLQAYGANLRSQLTEMEESYMENRRELLAGIDRTIVTAASAKEHLLNQDLNAWKVRQKLAQISPKAEQDKLAKELDRLDPIFEECGDELRKLRSIIENVEQDTIQLGGTPDSKLLEHKNNINLIIYQFVWESCVVARQPPCVLMKVRAPQGGDAQRRTTVRPACQPVLRLLGGGSLGLRVASKEEVVCYIISEEQARNLGVAGYEVKPIGQLLHNKARFESDDCKPHRRYFASFSRPMSLTDIQRPAEGTEAIPRLRYYLLFLVKLCGAIQVGGGPQMTLQGGKLSLPLAALVHPRQEYEQGGDAYIFWDLAFSEGQGILTPVPKENHPGVPWPLAKDALDRKFQQLIEGPKQDSRVKVGLSEIALNHLAKKFFGPLPNNSQDYSQCCLPWNKFFKEKDNNTMCTFREWFYKAADIVNRKLFDHWNNNLIVGFVSKAMAEQILISQQKPTMIIKFSDGNLGCLIISYYKPGCSIPPQHLKVAANDLDVVPLGKCVKQCPELHNISWIYPNHPVSDLWKDEGEETTTNQPQACDPYARRMFIGMQVENPVTSWEAPDTPANLDLDTIYDWLSEQDMPGSEVIQGHDLQANWADIQPFYPNQNQALLNDFQQINMGGSPPPQLVNSPQNMGQMVNSPQQSGNFLNNAAMASLQSI